jgi:hypothetical protein
VTVVLREWDKSTGLEELVRGKRCIAGRRLRAPPDIPEFWADGRTEIAHIEQPEVNGVARGRCVASWWLGHC